MSVPSPEKPRSRVLILLVLLLSLTLGVGIWLLVRARWGEPTLLELNAQGVGHMDRYEFAEALAVFEKVHAKDPQWLPGRINLAISLLVFGKGTETDKDAAYHRAEALLRDIVAREPNNPYGHFNLGYYLLEVRNDWEQAASHFEQVTKIDPIDPWAWFWLGKCQVEDPEKALSAYRKALALDPYNASTLYVLHGHLRQAGQIEEAARLFAEWERLTQSKVETPSNTAKFYTERGKYAQVIGRVPTPTGPEKEALPLPLFEPLSGLSIELAAESRWATADDLGSGPLGELRRQLRARFGGTLVAFDYDGDGLPDVLLLGAVVDKEGLRDLLLHNEGKGRFRDVTAEAGLAGARVSLGCCVGDYDNDRKPDLLLTGAGKQYLFHNLGMGRFEDVSQRAGLDAIRSVCLGAAMVDLEQDSDLDIILSQYAPEVGKAPAPDSPGLVVFWNVGEAKPRSLTEDPPPLETAFRKADGPGDLLGQGPVVATLISDLDLDNDLDLMALTEGGSPVAILNDRVQRFHRKPLPQSLIPPGKPTGALVLDVNHDGRSDLLFLSAEAGPNLLLHEAFTPETDPVRWYRREPLEAPPLRQSRAIDLDLDAWVDVVGLTRDGKPVLLRNLRGRLTPIPDAFGAADTLGIPALASTCADIDCDGYPDLVLWSESRGLLVQRSRGNGNHGLKLRPTGHRRVESTGGGVIRCNSDGIGVRLEAQVGHHWTGGEYTTLAAGLGQAHEVYHLGLGKNNLADVLRLYWPDGCQQAEFSLPADPPCQVITLHQASRKLDSCPILFTWDGTRFVFVNDFLGAGSVGEPIPGGGHRPPRPEESVKIEAEQLAPRQGYYTMKIAEPLNEVTYLDRLRLIVLDHPSGLRVEPDERFPGGDREPTQELLALGTPIFPNQARDQRGRDVLDLLKARDRRMVSDFARRSWIGIAEEHSVELDFGDRLAQLPKDQRLFLCLVGWTDYPYPESILAATQAGVALVPPVLERCGPDGRWLPLANPSFPAGLPRLMTFELTGRLQGPMCRLRLRTNMHIHWDQIFLAPLVEIVPEHGGNRQVRSQALEVADATLAWRGVMQEFSPDGREPTIYDHDRLEAVPVSRLSGSLTRFGDVTELLRATDDRFVLFGPGDELTVRFEARALPPLPEGWKRSFVLRTWGYCKDLAPLTAAGGSVEPLPFRSMSNYPPGPEEKHPDPDYARTWNTRRMNPRR